MKRRKYPRFHVELRYSFLQDQLAGEGTVLDLSMEGCSVRSDTPGIKGVYMELFINLLGQIPPLPVELAVIRWSAGLVSGLEFIRIADRHHARLRQYLQDLEQTLKSRVPRTSPKGVTKVNVFKR